jgi:S1-C subfamily serine protease
MGATLAGSALTGSTPAVSAAPAAPAAAGAHPAVSCSNGPTGSSGFPGFGWPFPPIGPSGFTGIFGPSGESGASGMTPQVQRVARSIDPALVDINVDLAYQDAEAAGTGIVLGSHGLILTNNHVIREETGIQVVDLGNNRTYNAVVAGYDLRADVAVVQLLNASGLRSAPIGDSSRLQMGNDVVALGNACGAGGTPSVAPGQVTALHQSITASDELTGSETLTNMIETNANIQPGDSGGSLVNQRSGAVIGVDTAGAQGYALSGGNAGFAVPINTAMAIVAQIEKGHASATVHVGPTAFLGVTVESTRYQGTDGIERTGVAVESVVRGGSAARAGLAKGDVIIALAGVAASSPSALTNELLVLKAGQRVPIRWMDSKGRQHTSTATLASGPPQ